MKACCFIGADIYFNRNAMKSKLIAEIYQAIIEGDYDIFVVSYGNSFDKMVLSCLKEVRKKVPDIMIKVAIPHSTVKRMKEEADFKKVVEEELKGVGKTPMEISHINYKLRPIAHYLLMADMGDMVLCFLNPNDKISPESIALQKINEGKKANIFNIYNNNLVRVVDNIDMMEYLSYQTFSPPPNKGK